MEPISIFWRAVFWIVVILTLVLQMIPTAMDKLLAKLNFKEGFQSYLHLSKQAPKSLASLLSTVGWSEASATSLDFALVFVESPQEIEVQIDSLEPKLKEDAVLWFCYLKKSSKKFQGIITRDQGWEALGAYQYEPVRQVAIDADWSALRFRKLKHIKTMTRRESMRISR